MTTPTDLPALPETRVLASGVINGKPVELRGWHEGDLTAWLERLNAALAASAPSRAVEALTGPIQRYAMDGSAPFHSERGPWVRYADHQVRFERLVAALPAQPEVRLTKDEQAVMRSALLRSGRVVHPEVRTTLTDEDIKRVLVESSGHEWTSPEFAVTFARAVLAAAGVQPEGREGL